MRSRALRYPLPAYTRYTHLPSLAVKISSARGGWVDPKLLLHAAFPITFVQPGIQEATRRKPASSVPKRSAEGDRKEKAKQERARERERERERKSGFKTLEIWESVVKPWINLSAKATAALPVL